jgi:hypothetical protein
MATLLPVYYLPNFTLEKAPRFNINNVSGDNPVRAGDTNLFSLLPTHAPTPGHIQASSQLVHAWKSSIDVVDPPMILGPRHIYSMNEWNAKQKALDTSNKNMMRHITGKAGTVQEFVRANIEWKNLSVHVGNLDLVVRKLRFPTPNETQGQQVRRLETRRLFKQAFRIHKQHANAIIDKQLNEARARVNALSDPDNIRHPSVATLRHYETLYGNGIQSACSEVYFQSRAEVPELERFYSELSDHERGHFWYAKFTSDRMVDTFWVYRNVLDFRYVGYSDFALEISANTI